MNTAFSFSSAPRAARGAQGAVSAARPPRRWLRLTLLLVIFLSGMLSGAKLALTFARPQITYHQEQPETIAAQIAARLRRPLGLDDQQLEEVERILRQRQQRLLEIRLRFQPEIAAELDLVHEQIGSVLDDPQRERWNDICRRLRHAWAPDAPPAAADADR